jgi:PTS system N-acetylgalactosamine-specific IIA component
VGEEGVLLPVSNEQHGADGIEQAVGEIVNRTGIRTVFTDLPAGSATVAVRRLQRRMPGLTVVTGANLAMLLDFVQACVRDGGANRDSDATRAERALEKGRSAMVVYGAQHGG